MKTASWKTSVCGGLAMIFTGVAAIVPIQYAPFALGAATIFNALGNFFARDVNVTSEEQGLKPFCGKGD